jgi:tRNA (guanosine-2'-O-)-methyltransferase
MTGSQITGSQITGSQITGSQITGSQITGSQITGSPGRRQLSPTDVKRLNRSWRRRTEARICLLLDSVSQPFNVGSIIRTAAALGVDHIWLCGDSATPEHPSARKTALGTERYLTWEQVSQAAAAAAAAKAAGLRVIAIELAQDATPLHAAPLDGDVCLALGHEDRGCSSALLAAADAVAYVPQTGRVGSLNVAAAAAIALAETRRREWQQA